MRRARLKAEVTRDELFGRLELDGNTIDGPTARIISARAGARWQQHGVDASLALGVFKVPFGRDVPQSDQDRVMLEAGAAGRALFPGSYDGGVLATAAWRGVELAVALTNSAPSGDAQFKGRDPSSSWDLVGRAGARGQLGELVIVAGGVSALTGRGLHPGTPAIKDDVEWVDGNEDGIVQITELVPTSGAPATPSERFDHAAVGADLAIGWCLCALGRGELSVEVSLATNLDRGREYADPIAADRDLRELGWQVMVVQAITPHGQIAVRYDEYRPDRDASEAQGAMIVPTDPRYRTLAVAAEAHTAHARLILQYAHEDNPRGRGLDGAPTTVAADRVTVRAQVSF